MRGKRVKSLKKLLNDAIKQNAQIINSRPQKYKNNVTGFVRNLFRRVKRDYSQHKVTAVEFTDTH